MSAEVHLECKKRDDSVPAFASHVPTVTLISHRERREKLGASRLQPGGFDHNLAAGRRYGRSVSVFFFSYRTCFMRSYGCVLNVTSDEGCGGCLVCSLSRSD